MLVVETSDLSSNCPVVVQSVNAGQTPVIVFVTVVWVTLLLKGLAQALAFSPILGSVPASSRSMLLRWRQRTIKLAINDTTT